MKKLFIIFAGLTLLSACASNTPPATGQAAAPKVKYQGVFVPAEYASKFEPGVDEHTVRWIRPGVNFSKYKKVMVDYVIFALAPNSEYKGINGDEMKKLGDAASQALVNALSEKFPVVSEPGPDVVRIRFAIVDIKQSKPVISTITTVVPVGLGINLVKKGITDEWSGAGLTKAEVMFHDSMTGEVIAAGYGDYSAAFSERFSKWGSIEDAFKKWGLQIVNIYEKLTTEKPKKEM